MVENLGSAAMQRLRAAVEWSPSGLLMADDDGRIVLVNRQIERLFGYEREELLGKPVEVLVPPVSAVSAGRDLHGRHKDGSDVPVEIGLTSVVTEEGTFVLRAVVDLSARQKAEDERVRLVEQLRHAHKMEAIGVLAGGIAHDFNNILGAIMGYAELVREHTEGETREDLDRLLQAAGHGKHVIDRILRFTRRQDTERHLTDLAVPVAETVQLLRSSLPAAIALHVSVAEDTPRVMVDDTAVHQVLLNLGTNAAHAMSGRGVIEIALAPFYSRDSSVRLNPELREGLYALLSLKDTGTGMTPEVLARVFEPFYSTKKLDEGTGLGLPMVRSLLRDHRGAVLIESEPGRGTVVKCFFPASPVVAEELPALVVNGPVPRGHGERILFVDDQPAMADVGTRRLVSLGYEVAAFTAPAAALAAVVANPAAWDLLMTDNSMPGMSGLELALAATDLHPGLPVLMMTGWAEDLPPDRLQAAGVRGLLAKPATLAELAVAVHAALVRDDA
jgi:signal transduction histidine kinase/ActR/RegA family two-component response regulator